MNQAWTESSAKIKRVPRVGGDEPVAILIQINMIDVFPAWAGMNRWPTQRSPMQSGVLRVGGDEPRGDHGARDRDIRAQFDHLFYADVPSAQVIGMLCARYGLSERSLRRILKK